jgi:ATP-dependent DNA helicase 2 subunit 2
MAGKEAIAFVIDASPSMAAPYGVTDDEQQQQQQQQQQQDISISRDGGSQGQQEGDDDRDGQEAEGPIELPESQMSAMGAEAEAALLGVIGDEVENLDDDDDNHGGNDQHGINKTRLAAAKEACVSMITNLILQSKTNECTVVICKSDRTKHHLCAPEQVEAGTAPFKNILELCEMTRPTVSLLRDVMAVQPTVKKETNQDGEDGRDMMMEIPKNDSTSGDLCDGIIVASDALFRKTDKRKYRRRLVVFTDAQHEINVDESQLMMVVEGLKKLECTLTVIGLDFVNSAEFDKPATEDDAAGGGDAMSEDGSDDEEKEDTDEEEGSDEDVNGDDDSDGGDETDKERKARIKDENEKLLISLAKLTGGKVIAASTLQQVLDSTRGRRIPKSTRRKVEFNIAPGLSIQARYSLMLSRANIKSLKREVVLVDKEGNPKKNSLNEEMMAGVESETSHWDADNEHLEVPPHKRTKAFKYGADLIPVGVWDETALKFLSPVSITILGYMPHKQIPRYLHIGDPYAVTGEDSRRSAVAISALAQAMYKKGDAAICKFVKTKDGDPLLAALFPLVENEDVVDENEGSSDDTGGKTVFGENNTSSSDDSGGGDEEGEGGAENTNTVRPKGPHRLYLVQLPFAKDVNGFSMAPLEDHPGEVDAAKCDALVDSLMLPDDCLQSEKIGNPAVRSFNKTLIDRAIDPNAPLAFTRSKGPDDPMSCPAEIKERAKDAIGAFLTTFPTRPEEVSQKGNKKGTGSKPFLSTAAY